MIIHSFAMADTKYLPGLKSFLRLLLCLAALLIMPCRAARCAQRPERRLPGTITGVINTDYPGSADAAANATSITLGAKPVLRLG